jgi:HlyD family secretion protein
MSVVVVIAAISAVVVLLPQAQANGQGNAAGRAAGAGGGRFAAAANSTAKVDKGSVVSSITATGTILAAQQSNLTFDTTGIVSSVSAQEGQQVKAGDVLAQVADTDQQYAVTQAQQNVNSAQAALDKLLQPVDANTVAIAQAQLKAAQGALQSKRGSVSAATVKVYQDRLQQAQTDDDNANKAKNDAGGRYALTDPNYQSALAQAGQADLNLQLAKLNLQEAQKGTPLGGSEANVALAQAKLAQTMAGPTQVEIDQAQVSLVVAQTQLQEAQEALAKTKLIAPYAGVVSQISVKVGQPADGTAMVLTDLSNCYITVNVDESDVTHITSGNPVSLTVDAIPNATLTGKVDHIVPMADTTASVITYPVWLSLDATTQPIRPGMTVNAEIATQSVDNVLRVPNNYLIFTRTGQPTVSIQNPDGFTTSTVNVKIGLQGADYTEIIDGVNLGDTLVLTNRATTTTGTTNTTAQQ